MRRTISLMGMAAVMSATHAAESPAAHPQAARRTAPATRVREQAHVPLAFKQFFEPSARALRPSVKLLELNGRRVTVAGFMARQEEPSKGTFALCPHPVFCDEQGGGSADLPPESVLVEVPGREMSQIPFVDGPVLVTGTLHVGHSVGADGRVVRIRLVLDTPRTASWMYEDTPSSR